ncbi:MAG: DUF6907 domain-containing protein [Actinocrinis sp.]
MRAIVPIQAPAVTPALSARVERALKIVSGRSVEDTLDGITAVLADAERRPRPYWLGVPCPPWCEGLHNADDRFDDRAHMWLSTPLDLSLYEFGAGEHRGPGRMMLAVEQHYRDAEPRIDVVVPRAEYSRPHEVAGESTVSLTAAEARVLHRQLGEVLAAVDGPRPAAGGSADPLAVMLDAAHVEGFDAVASGLSQLDADWFAACTAARVEVGRRAEVEAVDAALAEACASPALRVRVMDRVGSLAASPAWDVASDAEAASLAYTLAAIDAAVCGQDDQAWSWFRQARQVAGEDARGGSER